MIKRFLRSGISLAALAALGAQAQNLPAGISSQLDPVVISAERSRQTTFDAPAAISAVTRETIESAGPQVNLSEALSRVPGITVLNRQNYAQDLQLSIRGFGSRSTFGIRGVRLIVDGIPASMPDGQGQASNISLGSVGRIEVLRGPLAQLYGNAAGGVVQVFTEDDAPVPTVTLSAAAGPYHQFKIGTKFSTSTPGYGLTLDASHYQTDGYREHSEARRGQFNARWQSDLAPGTHVSVVLNALEQPVSQDPGGLNRAQFEGDPRQVVAAAITQDARKTVRQQQVGVVVDQHLGVFTLLTGRLYVGTRDLDNALSIAPAAQTSPTAAGGIVQFARTYAGGGLQVSHRYKLDAGLAARVTAGVEVDTMREDRQGYVNAAGIATTLKRNELNRVRNTDFFVQGSYDLTQAFAATAGLRSSRVRFESDDRFITLNTTPVNPDDSGSFSYRATNPVVGVLWHADPVLNVYANLGKGFETPTFTEVAYRGNGQTGLNSDLKASRSRHAELGAKWKVAPGHRVDVAVFDIRTEDEIVVASNTGGRSVFANSGRTSRRGAELAYGGEWTEEWRTALSMSVLRARYEDAFATFRGTTAIQVPAGNGLPGTPNRSAFAELAWTPKDAWGGFNAGLEVVHTGRLIVNDLNEDAAPAATVLNLRAGFEQQFEGWQLKEWLRVDNAADRRYAGSVIVNEGTVAAQGGGRYYEPALPRNWWLGVTARYAFQ